MVYDSWKKVFKLATTVAAEMRKKDPKLKVAQSTKKAFKDPRVLKAREEYAAHKKKVGKAEGSVEGGGSHRGRTAHRKSTGSRKKTVRKTKSRSRSRSRSRK
jgi:hypothetical protein